MIRSSRLMRDSMMQSHRVPNPVAVVNRYWPSRQHAPSFAYTQPSYRFRYRPFALGLDLPVGVPCTSEANCPSGTCCPTSAAAIPEVGLSTNICLDVATCQAVTNKMERALCARHPGASTLECDESGWCICQGNLNPVEGQIPPAPPPQTTTPPTGEPLEPVPAPAPSKATSWTDKVDLPVVAVGGLAALALLYAISR